MIKNVSRSLVVDATIERAYEIWSDFVGLPSFVRHVEQVRVEGRRLRWRVRREEWNALMTEPPPDKSAGPHRLEGIPLYAVVSMSPTDDGRTKVTLGAEYEVPPGEPDDNGARYEQILQGLKEHSAGAAKGPGTRAKTNRGAKV